jgi:hypothetical protein
MKYLIRLIWLLLCLGWVLSTILFALQGGFGGGHLRFDQALYFLGLPWNQMTLPEMIVKHDWTFIVAIPWIINTIIAVLITILSHRRLKR